MFITKTHTDSHSFTIKQQLKLFTVRLFDACCGCCEISNRGMKFFFGTFSQTWYSQNRKSNAESLICDYFYASHGLNALTLL